MKLDLGSCWSRSLTRFLGDRWRCTQRNDLPVHRNIDQHRSRRLETSQRHVKCMWLIAINIRVKRITHHRSLIRNQHHWQAVNVQSYYKQLTQYHMHYLLPMFFFFTSGSSVIVYNNICVCNRLCFYIFNLLYIISTYPVIFVVTAKHNERICIIA